MKKMCFSFLMLCFISFLSANNNLQPLCYEQKAINILNHARNKIKAYDAVYFEFDFSGPDTDPIPYTNQGFLYVKGDKYYIKSGEMIFISDGTLAWTFLSDYNEVHISYLSDAEGAFSPITLLDHFDSDFTPLWISENIINNNKANIIDLVPVEPQPFSKYRLAIDIETAGVLFTIAYDRQGNTYTYTVTEMLVNPDVDDDLFVFDPSVHPDIEIVDLR